MGEHLKWIVALGQNMHGTVKLAQCCHTELVFEMSFTSTMDEA